jgi:hypothetical protein
MSRWLVLTVLLLAPAALGCGAGVSASVHPGLANAAKLGSTQASDDRVTDVIANGDDGCGRTPEQAGQAGASGYVGNRIPPCTTLTPTQFLTPAVSSGSSGETEDLVVQPWLNHFYVGWPCPTETSRHARAWTASAVVATCAVP